MSRLGGDFSVSGRSPRPTESPAMQMNWLEFWHLAAASQYGIVIAVSDVGRAKQLLYQARSKAGDPALSGIQIRVSPVLPNEELWLVKESPDAAPSK